MLGRGRSKKKILVFGTGSGGRASYKSHCASYHIIAFVDNNKNIQGQSLFGSLIISPEEIKNYEFDYIIIASDYHVEIKKQLTDILQIPLNKLVLFQLENSIKKASFFINSKNWFLMKFSRFSYKKAQFFMRILKCLSMKNTHFQLYKLVWLDEAIQHEIFEVLPKKQVYSFGSDFIYKKKRKRKIQLPAVNFYLFKNVKTSVTSRSWLVNEQCLFVERVPSMPIGLGDYASGQLNFHGENFGILRKQTVSEINKGIMINGVSDTNYYHWLIEILPQLEFIKSLPSQYKEYPILLSNNVKNISSIMQALTYCQVENNIVYLKSSEMYLVKQLIVCSSPNFSNTHLKNHTSFPIQSSYCREESLMYLKNTILNSVQVNSSYGEYIFLARKSSNRLYNQNEVVQLLLGYNFSVVYLEDHPIEEQAAIINKAKFIVSPPGAALANLIFASKGTKALYWLANSSGDPSCFSNIAHHMEMELKCINYDVERRTTQDNYTQPYVIDIKAIKHWVEKVINN